MPDVAEQPPQPTDGHGRRIYVYWAVALTLLTLLGIFCWAVAVPYVQARAVSAQFRDRFWTFRPADADDPRCRQLGGRLVEGLGGAASAARKMGLYLRLPDSVTPGRKEAIYLLGCCGDSGVSTLAALAIEADKDTLLHLAAALGTTGSECAVVPLSELLESSDKSVRGEAAISLARIASPAGTGPLVSALKNGVPQLGQVDGVSWASDWTGTAKPTGRWENDGYGHVVCGALGMIGKPAVEPLLGMLRSQDPDTRRRALAALAEVRDPCVVKSASEALWDGDSGVRCWAAYALGQSGSKEAVPALRNALADEDGFVRSTAAGALAKLLSPEDTKALTNHPDRCVRESADMTTKDLIRARPDPVRVLELREALWRQRL